MSLNASKMPANAAIAAATAKAYSLAVNTLIPSEAAARSLLRTAMSRRPERDRRRFATITDASTKNARHTRKYRSGWSAELTSQPKISVRPIGVTEPISPV